MRRHALPLAAAFLVTACSSSPEPPGLSPDDEAAIRAVLADWDRMVSAGDIVSTASLLADDYVEMRPVAVVGPEAARETYSGFSTTYTSAQSTIRRLEGVGNLAYVWSEFDARFTRQDGNRVAQNGNTLWVLRKDPEGQWRIVAAGFQAASRPDTTSAG